MTDTLVIAIGVVAVSFGAILIRLASDASPLAIAAWRLLFSTGFIGGIMAARGNVLGGAALFCLSDAVLGWHEFVRPSRRALVRYHMVSGAIPMSTSRMAKSGPLTCS